MQLLAANPIGIPWAREETTKACRPNF